MISVVDGMLRHLLGTRVPGMTEARVGFEPPDANWRNHVATLTGTAINCYLVELRENRSLRSNEVLRDSTPSGFVERKAPARLDCVYLLSAWSPVPPGNPVVQPVFDEVDVLYDVARVLMDSAPVDPVAVYLPGPLPAGFPEALLEPLLPAVVTPPEGFAKLADFWMRMDWVWKPVVELVLTIPVVAAARPAAGPVLTVTSVAQQDALAATAESLLIIGGAVRAGAPPAPLAGAWVRVVELDRTAVTDSEGRFVFSGLVAGTYTLQAGAAGHATVTRSVDLPSPSGEYDLVLP